MRIIKEFNHGPIKCSVLHHNERYTLKLEDQYCEVSYKLGSIDSIDLASLPSLLSTPQINDQIKESFMRTRTGRDRLLNILTQEDEEMFDTIM